ncbi:ABC transporter ATP-binding protein [Bogoriella caseilytica]|uniref:ABC-type lipoprotein export system ATPase subunit n=1 Tax=Bogoriella caseilytica TaxID=56055 RepID=A0A3N2BBE2_9MICO|nr:ABC transporter ATP-binding protein [Bogoriella caseilytica]ROR72579.1 ABC-type lipoprotein export system ATPase subunit [Bogoriella caseilytica]
MTAPHTTGSARGRAGGIHCEELVRIFSTEGIEVQALQGLNLHVEPGELVAVVGASGSGKSTLLSILSGLDTPSAGRASVAGADLLTMSRRRRVAYRRHDIGFIWQQTSRNLLGYLTAAENVHLPLTLARHRRGAAAREHVDGLLDLLGVAHCRDRRPQEMSGGEQQRVAIAVALANDPQVLLADEPTGELDEATSADVLETLRSVNRELGVTVLIVTHDPTVSEHVSRTVQIRDGRTSTEVVRRRETDAEGRESDVAEEYAVLDRVGRLQLPEDYVQALDLRERVRLTMEADHAGVWADETQRAGPHRSDAAGTRPDGENR